MKVKRMRFLVMFFILSLLYGWIFSQNIGSLLWEFQEDQLTESLELTPEQVDSVKEIIKMLQAQETVDRQNFKNNALALVAAAVRRAYMAEIRLFNDLNDSQKAKLTEIKEAQKKDREFFNLKEGLILSAEQAVKVRTILQIYASQRNVSSDAYDNMEALLDPMGYGYGPGYGMSGTMPGTIPGTIPGTMQRNIPGTAYDDMPASRRAGTMRMNDGVIEKLKSLEAKKEKAIEQILTADQKKLFNQLKEERHKELELIYDKLRENQN